MAGGGWGHRLEEDPGAMCSPPHGDVGDEVQTLTEVEIHAAQSAGNLVQMRER